MCFRFFGFDIDWGDQQPTNCRLIKSFYRFIWLLINTASVGCMAYCVWHFMVSYNGTHHKINLQIAFGTAAVQVAGTYGSLVMAAWKDGGQLAESLRRIEARMPISKEMLKKIRIASITSATAAPILVSCILELNLFGRRATKFFISCILDAL